MKEVFEEAMANLKKIMPKDNGDVNCAFALLRKVWDETYEDNFTYGKLVLLDAYMQKYGIVLAPVRLNDCAERTYLFVCPYVVRYPSFKKFVDAFSVDVALKWTYIACNKQILDLLFEKRDELNEILFQNSHIRPFQGRLNGFLYPEKAKSEFEAHKMKPLTYDFGGETVETDLFFPQVGLLNKRGKFVKTKYPQSLEILPWNEV